jgi:hypothetical protein
LKMTSTCLGLEGLEFTDMNISIWSPYGLVGSLTGISEVFEVGVSRVEMNLVLCGRYVWRYC